MHHAGAHCGYARRYGDGFHRRLRAHAEHDSTPRQVSTGGLISIRLPRQAQLISSPDHTRVLLGRSICRVSWQGTCPTANKDLPFTSLHSTRLTPKKAKIFTAACMRVHQSLSLCQIVDIPGMPCACDCRCLQHEQRHVVASSYRVLVTVCLGDCQLFLSVQPHQLLS